MKIRYLILFAVLIQFLSLPSFAQVAQWRLNNDAADASGNSINGTLINSAGFTTDSKEGTHALTTNGTNQYIDFGNPSGLPSGTSSRTISLWAKTNTVSGTHVGFSYGTATNSQSMYLGQSGTSLVAGAFTNGLTVTNFWATGVWHHICLTYNGTMAKLYADGVEVSSSTKNWPLVLLRVYIGRNVNNNDYWNGTLDDVRIYNTALTATEVQALAVSQPPPTAPSNMTATANGSSQIDLNWTDNSNNETGFQIERSLTSGSGYSLVSTTAAGITTFANTGLTPGTTYYYRIRAINGSGNSSYTTEASATTTVVMPPSAPTGLTTVAVSTTTINLSWIDNSNNETGFEIERSQTSGSGYSLISTAAVNAVTFTSTGLAEGTTYYFRVRAVNADGNSSYTSPATATTSSTAPAAPSALNAVAGSSTTINLTWTDNSNNETGFQVERSLTAGSGYTLIHTTAANTNSFSNTGLSASTTYYYRIRAINASGNSLYTSEANTITTATGGSTAGAWRLDNNVTDASGNGINGTLMNSPGFTTDNKEGTHALTTNGTNQYVDLGNPSGLPSGTASRSISMWAKTNTVSGTHVGFAYGTGVNSQSMYLGQNGTSLVAGAFTNGLTVTNFWATGVWHHICLTYNGTTAKLYADGVEVSSAAKNWPLVLLRAYIGRNVNNSDYWNGTIDDVRIYSTALTAAEVQILAISPPAAPSNVVATASNYSQVNLSWTDNSNNEAGFQVERSLTLGSGYSLINTTAANAVTFSDTGLSANVTYYYRIRAVNGAGNSLYTTEVNVTTPNVSPLEPGNLVAVALSSAVTLSWADNSTNETGFEIQRSTTSGGGYILIGTTTANINTFVNTNLTAETTYYYRIRAINAVGSSTYVNIAVTTLIYEGSVPDAIEFAALKDLYDALDGSWSWYHSDNWPHAGAWPVTATSNEFQHWYGIVIEDGDVKELNFAGNNLIGVMPATISNLARLEKINLRNNYLSEFPNLSGLHALKTLLLSQDGVDGGGNEMPNYPAGAIPSWLWSLTNLEYIDIHSTNRTGSINAAISNLTHLKKLNLTFNGLIGPIPASIGELDDLEELLLSSNEINGGIPSSIGGLGKLQVLYIDHNKLGSPLPGTIGSLLNLSALNLSNNRLSGPLPASLPSLSNLQYLNLQANEFTGSIPANFGDLNNLNLLYLGSNQFTSLGNELREMDNLTTLDATNNFLSTWPNLNGSHIKSLKLGTNPFPIGVFPGWILSMSSLEELDLSYTQITGAIPEQIQQLHELQHVYLDHNDFRGGIPVFAPALRTLSLSSNKLNGEIPSWIFDLGYDEEHSYDNYAGLRVLKLNNNNLIGGIPSPVYSNVSLIEMDLSYNRLSGVLSGNLRNLRILQYFNISHNQFSGAYPENGDFSNWCGSSYLSNCTKLVFSDFSYNQFTALPDSFWGLIRYSETIKLDHNLLSSIGDPSVEGRTSNCIVTLNDNALDFIDLEPLGPMVNRTSSIFFPQQTIANEEPVVSILDAYFAIVGSPLGQHSSIIWEKKQSDGSWLDVSSLNQAMGENFVSYSATADDEGFYRWRMRSSVFPGKEILPSSTTQVQMVAEVNAAPVQAMHNGLITAVRWRTDRAYGVSAEQFSGMYVYSYDDRYQISEARWANADHTLNTFAITDNQYRLTGMLYDANGNIRALQRYNENGIRTNNFAYHYEYDEPSPKYNNKLKTVDGYASFAYNSIGQMVNADKEGIENDQYVDYDVSGKVTKVFNKPTKLPADLVMENMYDDRGFRLAKVVYPTVAGEQVRTTWYIRDASGNVLSTYEQIGGAVVGNTHDVVRTEMPVYGSGKLGTYYSQQDGSMSYEITDHLGNVRALLRDNVTVFKATMEDNGIEGLSNPRSEEEQFFINLNATEVTDVHMNHSAPIPGIVDAPDKAAYLHWVDGFAGMDAEDKSVGPAIMLHVNAGDMVKVETWAKYENKTSYNRDIDLLLLSQFLGGTFANVGGFEGMTPAVTGQIINDALGAANYGNDTEQSRPFAYLNYIVFDNNMNDVDAKSVRISTEAGYETEVLNLPDSDPARIAFDNAIKINTNGYIYVWVSNESENTNVWFDDLTIEHTMGIVTQATDYGVWGDVLREQKSDESVYRFGYQGQFAEKDKETGWNHFELREYDPIIGRWTAVDPMRQHYSPYVGMGNNPVSSTDPDGGEDESPYYDEFGNFLGVDENGFSGEVRIMSKFAWDNLNIGNDKGYISSEAGYKNSVGINYAGLSSESLSLIHMDIVFRMPDIPNSNFLLNGKFSVYNDVTGERYNNAYPTYTPSTGIVDGKIRVTIPGPKLSYTTVEEIQLTYGMHEFLGHGYIQRIQKQSGFKHSDVFNLEKNHPLFNKTSKDYQQNVINMGNNYKMRND